FKRSATTAIYTLSLHDALPIFTRDGKLVTRPGSSRILTGITMTVAKEVAKSLQLSLEERAFTVAEAQAASEAFLTSATQTVMPVDRKSTRLNSSHVKISYAVFC